MSKGGAPRWTAEQLEQFQSRQPGQIIEITAEQAAHLSSMPIPVRQSERLSIELPFPPPELSPNRKNGKHWSATHAAKGKYLAACRALTLQAMGTWVPPAGLLALDITFVQPDKRRRDIDNMLASIKAGVDGISQALGVDDQHFEPVTIRRKYGAKPGSVRVVITKEAV